MAGQPHDEETKVLPARPEASNGNGRDGVPRRAEGIELLGEYEGSGFEQTPYLVRRADGQVVQLPELLYIVLEGLEHRGGYNTLSHRVTEQVGAQLEADDARFLVNEKLAPLGLTANGRAQAPAKRGPKS